MKSPKLQGSRETCTACAGTIILEFAALSRLTGDPIFEEKARQAMDCLWSQRHRGSDLVGTVLNVHSGNALLTWFNKFICLFIYLIIFPSHKI